MQRALSPDCKPYCQCITAQRSCGLLSGQTRSWSAKQAGYCQRQFLEGPSRRQAGGGLAIGGQDKGRSGAYSACRPLCRPPAAGTAPISLPLLTVPVGHILPCRQLQKLQHPHPRWQCCHHQVWGIFSDESVCHGLVPCLQYGIPFRWRPLAIAQQLSLQLPNLWSHRCQQRPCHPWYKEAARNTQRS